MKEEISEETTTLLLIDDDDSGGCNGVIPKDSFHLAYMVYFTLGAGFLLPWNAFITAVDYFSYLYPAAPVDRVFSVAYMLSTLLFLFLVLVWARRSSGGFHRTNAGIALFLGSLLMVPIMDAVFVKGERGRYGAYWVTVGAVAVSGVADALVQGGVTGAAGEMPERYMQAIFAGTAASVYLLGNTNIAVGASIGRLLFYPLFLGCLQGPDFFRTEIPVMVLTCLLGLTNGYLTSVLMILTPKTFPIQHSEIAGILMVLFIGFGLATGSLISWFWVI